MILFILRGAFIVLVAAVIIFYVISNPDDPAAGGFQAMAQVSLPAVIAIVGGTIALAGTVVAIDASFKKKRLSAISGVFLGLIAGLLAAYALSFLVDLIGTYTAPSEPDKYKAVVNLLQGVKVLIGMITCYVGISLVLQTKDDFRFVIPYVEFAKQIRGARPTLLDTSVIVDGRILDIVTTRLLQGTLVVPKFVLDELQTIADSQDKLKRARGRRGLEVLQKLQEQAAAEIVIEDADAEGGNVDQKLVSLAKESQARIMTNDFNLNKIAQLRGVEVINLNDLAKAMRPVVLPGESLAVKIIKSGESPTQGVGYLEDGTMVVVEHARQHVGENIELIVTSAIQTSAGRMIFGRLTAGESSFESGSHDSPTPAAPASASASAATTAPAPPRSSHPSGRNPRRSG
jgi:uncharacterized protein YacL